MQRMRNQSTRSICARLFFYQPRQLNFFAFRCMQRTCPTLEQTTIIILFLHCVRMAVGKTNYFVQIKVFCKNCNFARNNPKTDIQCWGYNSNVPKARIDDLDIEELTPYPGYAGKVSEKAIKSGNWKMPLVPDEMAGGMGMVS